MMALNRSYVLSIGEYCTGIVDFVWQSDNYGQMRRYMENESNISAGREEMQKSNQLTALFNIIIPFSALLGKNNTFSLQ